MKIHPHIKHYVRSVLLADSKSKDDKWKEIVVKELEEKLFANIPTTITIESYQKSVDTVVKEFEDNDMKNFLNQIKIAFKQIPLNLLKNA